MVCTKAILGGSFNPPGKHHKLIVDYLLEDFDQVVIIPCGSQRKAKSSLGLVEPCHRKVMATLAFGGLRNVVFDFSDLENGVYTPTINLYKRYLFSYPNDELWFVVGGDLVKNGSQGMSEIQQSWVEGLWLWQNLNFAVMDHPACPVKAEDLPTRNRVVRCRSFVGRATDIRKLLQNGQDVGDLLEGRVLQYIKSHNLYSEEVII